MAAFPDEMACFFPLLAMGWRKVNHLENMTKFFLEMKYCSDEKVSKRRTDDFLGSRPKLGSGIVYSPLSKLLIEPEMIIMYGNPGQIMRLIRGYVHFKGVPIRSSFLGGLSCAEAFINCRKTQKAQVVVPGYGERVFGMTQDHEMSFYCPAQEIDMLIEGIENEHKIGTSRYPIPHFQMFTPRMPEKYVTFLNEKMEEKEVKDQ